MALDRYDRSARAKFDIALQPSNLEVASKQSTSLQNRLDRMSSLFYDQLKDRAVTQGQLYGIKNKPSIDQIAASIDRKDDPSNVFAQGGTIFGDAAKEIQGELYRQDLEGMMLNDSTQLLAAINAGAMPDDMTSDQIADYLEARVEGYATVLDQISPKQAVKFRASQYALGNKLYSSSLDLVQKRADAELNVLIKQNTLNYEYMLRDSLVANNGDIETTAFAMESQRSNIVKLIERSHSTQVANMDALNIAEMSAYKSALVQYVTDSSASFVPKGSTLLAELRKGNAGVFSDVWAMLDLSERKVLEEDIISSIGRVKDLDDNQIALNNIAMREKEQDVYIKFANNKITGEDAIKELRSYGKVLSRDLINAFTSPKPETDDTTKFEADLEFDIVTYKAKQADILTAFTDGDITAKGYARLLTKYTTVTKDVKTGISLIKAALHLPENTDWSRVTSERKIQYYRATKQLTEASQKALVDGVVFDETAEVEKILRGLKVIEFNEAIKSDIATINTLSNFNITEDNFWTIDIDGNGELSDDELKDIRKPSDRTLVKEAYQRLSDAMKKGQR